MLFMLYVYYAMYVKFRDGSSALHQLLSISRPLVRAVEVVSQPPTQSLSHKIEDDKPTTVKT